MSRDSKQFHIFTQGIHNTRHICIGDLVSDKLVRPRRWDLKNNKKVTAQYYFYYQTRFMGLYIFSIKFKIKCSDRYAYVCLCSVTRPATDLKANWQTAPAIFV